MANVPDRLPFKLGVLRPGMAAEVIGLNLSQAMGDALRQAILDAFHTFPVLVFATKHLISNRRSPFPKASAP